MERDKKQNDYYQDGDFRKRRLLVYVCTDENSVVLISWKNARGNACYAGPRFTDTTTDDTSCTYCARIVLAFSCKRAKTIMTIEIHYVCTRSFFLKREEKSPFFKNIRIRVDRASH